MNDSPQQLPLALPPGLDDETVLALWSFLNNLISQFEATYFLQLRRALDAQQPPRDRAALAAPQPSALKR